VQIEELKAEQVRPLRKRVLRPHQDVSELIYEGDEDPETVHFGLYHQGELSGIISLYHQSPPEHSRVDSDKSWRIRGMATVPECRGQGFGKALLNHGVRYARNKGAGEIWCNARGAVLGFYGGRGFEVRGEAFELSGIGEHFRMFLPVVSVQTLLAED
jgi:ribosomal protein S18 acetylase RimI-like enzyme